MELQYERSYYSSMGKDIGELIISLNNSSQKFCKCYLVNETKGIKDKWHLIISTNDNVQIQEDESIIKNSLCEKLFGVKIDNLTHCRDCLIPTPPENIRKTVFLTFSVSINMEHWPEMGI